MERVKEAAKVLKLYPKLRLGEKLEGGGVKSTGPHTVKITAEPTTTMMLKDTKSVKAFKFIVEEKGTLYKWLVPLTNEEGEGHYLVEHLLDVEVGEEIVLEMKKRGARNYIDISRTGDVEEEKEDVVAYDPSAGEADPSEIPD
jgi:hypothetical protein